ncbi:uncharacterized protein LOC126834554 isoform X2 [Adelges cooleyi]|uniref:uncharacterized protein LOC126834554 isoform X2 n=1 Tax=Adelges cooleyi TaxID=133065 RepID=UPI002180304E|nr:uncharacterized protein LOC126834554 isoform X2 [Adelges cooleyi]
MMKTECYYFFLTLTLVSILEFSAVDCSDIPDDYTRVVRHNNYVLQLCQNEHLPYLIEQVIRTDQTIEDISYTFAVPEKANHRSSESFQREERLRSLLRTFYRAPDARLLPDLGIKRRETVAKVMEFLITRISLGYMNKNLCRSLGLLRSVLDPESFINSFNINHGVCVVTSTIGGTVKSSKFKCVRDGIVQVEINDTDRTEPLSYSRAW